MTIHYHGTPLSPVAKLYELAGRHFCVPFPRPKLWMTVAAAIILELWRAREEIFLKSKDEDGRPV